MTKYFVDVGDETFEVQVSSGEVRLDGESVDADLVRVEGTDVWSLLINGRSCRVVGGNAGSGRWKLQFAGTTHATRVVDERTRHIEEMTGGNEGPKGPEPIIAPMPGLVMRIEVAEGDMIHAGQGVVIVEAMKMENELKANCEARVGRIHVSEGQAVEKGAVLIELEPLEQESEG